MTNANQRKHYVPWPIKVRLVFCTTCRAMRKHYPIAVWLDDQGAHFWGYCLACYAENESVKKIRAQAPRQKRTGDPGMSDRFDWYHPKTCKNCGKPIVKDTGIDAEIYMHVHTGRCGRPEPS